MCVNGMDRDKASHGLRMEEGWGTGETKVRNVARTKSLCSAEGVVGQGKIVVGLGLDRISHNIL